MAAEERRSAPRFDTRLPLLVMVPQEPSPRETFTANVSSSGLYFHTESPVPPGTELECVLTLPKSSIAGPEIRVRYPARVVRAEPRDTLIGVGVALGRPEFVD